MKKGFGKKALSVALAFSMVFTLAACGKKGQNGGSGGGGGKNNPAANAQLAKQNVFSSKELDYDFGEDFRISSTAVVGDRLYLMTNAYDYETYEDVFSLVSLKMDGSDVKKIELQEQESQKGSDSKEEPAETEEVEESSEEEEAETEEIEGEDEDGMAFGDDEGEDFEFDPGVYEGDSTYEYSYYGNATVTEDGCVYALRFYYFEDYSDPNNYIYEQSVYLDSWDLEGKARWSVELDPLKGDANGNSYGVSQIVDMKDGNVALMVNGPKTGKLTVDKSGNVSSIVPFQVESVVFDNQVSTVVSKDGKLVVAYASTESWDKQLICEIDLKTGEASAAKELPASIAYNGFYNVSPGYNTDFVYATNDGVYTYNIGDETPNKIMDYVNSDINVGAMNCIVMIDETHFFGIYNDAMEWKSVAGFFTKVNPEDIKDKQIMTLGGTYVSNDSDLMKRVVDFNKASDDYRIVVKDYSSYNTADDYMAGNTQLNNDIISGNMPDILQLSSDMPIQSYISKGLLANVDALIEKDEELSKVEFMQNVFDAYRVDGKLYQVIPSFRVQTYIAKKSLVGERTGWNMQELKEVLAKLPEGTQMFGDMTRDYFLSTIMDFCGSDFVDINTGKCSFDSQLFIELLEMAKTFPEEIGEESYDEDWWMNYQSQYRENRTLMKNMYIGSLQWVKEDINGYMGEDVSYVGFPTEKGQGSIILANESFGIAAKSSNPEGAWNFIRYYLTEEHQTSDRFWGLSVHKKVLEESKQRSMEKSYWLDENGEKVEYDDTIYINGEELKYDPLNQKQADELFAFICTVSKREYNNEDVQKIVEEEAEAFFSGQKSAKDVAGLIQNRVQLFINENR